MGYCVGSGAGVGAIGVGGITGVGSVVDVGAGDVAVVSVVLVAVFILNSRRSTVPWPPTSPHLPLDTIRLDTIRRHKIVLNAMKK